MRIKPQRISFNYPGKMSELPMSNGCHTEPILQVLDTLKHTMLLDPPTRKCFTKMAVHCLPSYTQDDTTSAISPRLPLVPVFSFAPPVEEQEETISHSPCSFSICFWSIISSVTNYIFSPCPPLLLRGSCFSSFNLASCLSTTHTHNSVTTTDTTKHRQ